jgi:hypothetical protein
MFEFRAVWIQAGYYLAIAAQIPAEQNKWAVRAYKAAAPDYLGYCYCRNLRLSCPWYFVPPRACPSEALLHPTVA